MSQSASGGAAAARPKVASPLKALKRHVVYKAWVVIMVPVTHNQNRNIQQTREERPAAATMPFCGGIYHPVRFE